RRRREDLPVQCRLDGAQPRQAGRDLFPGRGQEAADPGQEGTGQLPDRQHPCLGAAARWSLPAPAADRQPEPAQRAGEPVGEAHRPGGRDAIKTAACSHLMTLSLRERVPEGRERVYEPLGIFPLSWACSEPLSPGPSPINGRGEKAPFYNRARICSDRSSRSAWERIPGRSASVWAVPVRTP